MYLYCVYPAISKSPNELANCLKITETSVILVVFMTSSLTSALILLRFLSVALHESGTRNALLDP